MTFRLGLPRGFVYLLTSALIATASSSALASSRSCEYLLAPIQPVTQKTLRERSTKHLQELERLHPLSAFEDLGAEINNEQVGEIAPRALQQILGSEYKLVSTPAPSAPLDTAVNLHEEGKSIALHVDQEWHGRRTSTTVYASLPRTIRPSDSAHLIGADYPVVLVHLHGGGTPTASGKNGMSIGQALAGYNIPVLALDLPGHGQATRKVDGLSTFQDQIDWLLAIVNKLVDPRVKVVISGHSWGAEFTAFMQRQSDNPKYARIMAFVSLAPPVDVSLGGDEQKKVDFDHWFEKNFKEFEARSAPADFDFLSNVIKNGKTSWIGSYFTAFTFMDYKLPVQTADMRKNLKPHYVFQSEHDILVWVGREEPGKLQFGPDLTVIPEGTNWKSNGENDKFMTGHNQFDVYIPGTTKPLIYNFLAELLLKIAGPEGMGSEHVDAHAEMAPQIVSDFLRNYANFFLFRQMVNHHDEYITAATPDRAALTSRHSELENFVKAFAARDAQWRRETETRVAKALEVLRGKLAINEPLTLVRAQEELAMPELTGVRRKKLMDYLAAVDKVEHDIRINGVADPLYDQEMAAMQAEFGPLLASLGVSDLGNYKAKFEEYSKKGKLTPQENKIRSTLSRLDQKYSQAIKKRQSRFGQERDRRFGLTQHPDGILDHKMATRELNADHSPARRVQLENFVKEASLVEASTREAAATEWNQNFAKENKPSGVTSVDQAKAMKNDLELLADFSYVPTADLEVGKLAAEVQRLNSEREVLIHGQDGALGLVRLEKLDKEALNQRSSLVKRWDGIWKKGILSSSKLRDQEQLIQQKLEAYIALEQASEFQKGNWIRDLKKAGQLREDILVAGTPELKALREQVKVAKDAYIEVRDQLVGLHWEEALSGHLEGPQGAVQEAASIAKELWGADFKHPSPESIVASLRAQEENLEKLRRQASVVEQELDRTKWEYSQKMIEHGHKVPFTITRVSIREALDLSYTDLISRLRTDTALMNAFKNTMEQWSGYLSALRVESYTKDVVGSY